MVCSAVNITSANSTPNYGPAASSLSAHGTTTRVKTANGCTCQCQSPSDISTCTCTGCGTNAVKRGSAVAFNDRPLMFVADNGNDCLTPHTTAELRYPDPGPDVVQGDGAYPLELPSGSCGQKEMLAKQAYTG